MGYSIAAGEGAPTWTRIVVEKVAHEIAKRRSMEENKVLGMEKRKKWIKRSRKSWRELALGAQWPEKQGG